MASREDGDHPGKALVSSLVQRILTRHAAHSEEMLSSQALETGIGT